MSSVVTAPEGLPSRLNRATRLSRLDRGRLSADFGPGVLGTVVLAAVTFLAGGGTDLAANTWVQGGLLVIAAATAITAVLLSRRGRAWGGATVAFFAALAALTYASIAWSVQPASSWLEANRTLSYLAAFLTALLFARLAPGRWRALIGAVAAATTLACGYSLLTKVFPATLDANDSIGRLRAPFEYWNAVGLMAAIGLPACLWAGARREAARVLRALTVPALAVLLAAVVLSFSRGAVLVAAVAVGIWFALAPLRLRSALILALGAAGAAAISAWGIAHKGISADNIAPTTRVSAGRGFGLVILATLVLTTVAGLLASSRLDRVAASARLRRRIGGVLIGLLALIPVGGLVALARSHRGFSGEVSHLWHTLTNTNGYAVNQPGRLAQLSNSRPHYWSLAIKIGDHHPLAGVGALGFATAQIRYQTGPAWRLNVDNVTHAHSYVMETFADFGALGLATSLGLLVAWIVATARTFELEWTGRWPRPSRGPPLPELFAERAGLIALLAIVVAFGVHSLIDWTWFIPGNAVAALACAGWLVGRGPLSRAAGPLPQRRALLRSPAAVTGVAVIAAITLAGLWVIAQPLRSSDSYSAAIAAALHRHAGVALTDARSAASEDPVSIDPLFLLSRLYSELGASGLARHELVEATSRQPANPKTWEQLGCYDLGQHNSALAPTELHRALALEPGKTQIQTDPAAFCASVAA